MNEKWPVSVVDGVVQGSDAHLARGEGLAVDIACPVGTQTRCIFPPSVTLEDVTWYGVADTPCGGQWDYRGTDPETGDHYNVRYCHLQEIDGWPLTGNTGSSTGPHLHCKIWRNGQEIRYEELVWSNQK